MASARPFQRAKRTGGCHLLPSIGADRQGAKPPLAYIGSRRHAPRVPKCDPETGEVIEKKESFSALFFCVSIGGVLRHPPMGALCFVTLFGVVGAKPLPLGEPRVLKRSVKTHTGLLLTKVTKPCIMDSSKRKT